MSRGSHVATPGFDAREYREGDFSLIQRRPDDAKEDGAHFPMGYIAQSEKVTYTVGGEPAGLVGLFKIYDGVYHAWAIPSDKLRGYGRQVVRATRSLLLSYELILKARQFRTSAPGLATENIKWLRMIGFELECIQIGILPNGDNLYHFVRWTTLGKEIAQQCQRLNMNPITRVYGKGIRCRPKTFKLPESGS